MKYSSKKVKAKIQKGTVVAIPVSDNKFAISQIYKEGVVFYIIVYEGLKQLQDLVINPGEKVVLATWTNDAEIYRGRWIVVGDAPLEVKVLEPEYQVLVGGKAMAESFDGKSRRPVTAQDRLHSRKSRSPLILEDAVRAFHGLRAWSSSYDDMLVGRDI